MILSLAVVLAATSSAVPPAPDMAALHAAREGLYVRARELAEAVLRDDPRSAVGHYALGLALDEGEGNPPLALRHYTEARALTEKPGGGPAPGLEDLHREILFHQLWVLSDLGRYDDLLEATQQVRQWHDPGLFSLDVWPLMKLGREAEARLAAARALASGDKVQSALARNGLCALDGYPECAEMLKAVRGFGLEPGLALRNAAVSAIDVGRLEEAERLLLESTRHPSEEVNPWRDLAQLYASQGRLGEAVSAGAEMARLSRGLPRRLRQHERSTVLMEGAQLLLLLGQNLRALSTVVRASAEPDRTAHWSGSEEEILAEYSLLERTIRKAVAAEQREWAAVLPWREAGAASLHALFQDLSAWFAGKRVVPVLRKDGLEGSYRPPDPRRPQLSAPLWLLMDAVELQGPGPTLALAEKMMAESSQMDSPVPPELRRGQALALATEARWLAGDWEACFSQGSGARDLIPQGEVLLQARLAARMADAARRLGRLAEAWALYEEVMARDPGLMRRIDLPLPVSLGTFSTSLFQQAGRRAMSNPRFVPMEVSPFQLADDGQRLCLLGPGRSVLACGSEKPLGTDDPLAEPHARLVRNLVTEAFAPRLELSQADLTSLDGSAAAERSVDPQTLDWLQP